MLFNSVAFFPFITLKENYFPFLNNSFTPDPQWILPLIGTCYGFILHKYTKQRNSNSISIYMLHQWDNSETISLSFCLLHVEEQDNSSRHCGLLKLRSWLKPNQSPLGVSGIVGVPLTRQYCYEYCPGRWFSPHFHAVYETFLQISYIFFPGCQFFLVYLLKFGCML